MPFLLEELDIRAIQAPAEEVPRRIISHLYNALRRTLENGSPGLGSSPADLKRIFKLRKSRLDIYTFVQPGRIATSH
jgi:hypothetical protein